MTSRIVYIGFFIASLMLSGCATITTSTPPPVSGSSASLEISADGPGMNDYPLGAYEIPNSQVAVIKHRGMSKVEGGFGLMGVMHAHSDGKAKSKEALKGVEDSFRLDVAEVTRELVQRKLTESNTALDWRYVSPSQKPQGDLMEVTPYVFLSPMASGDARLYVYFKARYRAKGAKEWSTRYVYHGADMRPITGAGSWSENNGAHFKAAVNKGVSQAIDVMLQDAASNWPERRQANVTARFAPGLDTPETVAGDILMETSEYTLFTPNISNMTLTYGVHIIPKTDRVAQR